MRYGDSVIDHYESPRNVGFLDKTKKNVGTGLVGAPACGDVMRLQIEVNDEGYISDVKFKTFGCGSAIAASSLMTEIIKGLHIKKLDHITNDMIAEKLSLPPVKRHCSVLIEEALEAALQDYNSKQVSGSGSDVGNLGSE